MSINAINRFVTIIPYNQARPLSQKVPNAIIDKDAYCIIQQGDKILAKANAIKQNAILEYNSALYIIELFKRK